MTAQQEAYPATSVQRRAERAETEGEGLRN